MPNSTTRLTALLFRLNFISVLAPLLKLDLVADQPNPAACSSEAFLERQGVQAGWSCACFGAGLGSAASV